MKSKYLMITNLTKHVLDLQKNTRALIDSDWIAIKNEINAKKYKEHYDTFCKSFNMSYKKISRHKTQIYFTEEDTKIVKELFFENNIKCQYCQKSKRLFTKRGLIDHCRAVHNIQEM